MEVMKRPRGHSGPIVDRHGNVSVMGIIPAVAQGYLRDFTAVFGSRSLMGKSDPRKRVCVQVPPSVLNRALYLAAITSPPPTRPSGASGG